MLDERGPGAGHAEDEDRLRARIAEAPGAREELRVEGLDERVDAPDPLIDVELAAVPMDTIGAREVVEGTLVVLAVVVHASERKMEVAAILVAERPPFGNRLDPGDGLAVRLAESAQVREHRPREGQVGRELERAPAIRFRRLPISRDGARVRQQVESGRVIGIEGEDPVCAIDSARDIATGDQGGAEAKPGLDETRLQCEAAAVALDRPPRLAACSSDLGEHKVVARAVRTQRRRAQRRFLRLRQGSLFPTQQGEIRMRLRELRMLPDERVQQFPGIVELTRAMQRDREVEARRHMGGVELPRATQAGLRLPELSPVEMGASETVPGGNVLRGFLHHPPITVRRRIELLEIVVDGAELVAGFRPSRLPLERLAKRRRRPLQIPLRPEHPSEALPAARLGGRLFDCPPERGARAREITALVKKQAKILQCKGIVPVAREVAAIGPLRKVQAPAPMQLDGLDEESLRGSRTVPGSASTTGTPHALLHVPSFGDGLRNHRLIRFRGACPVRPGFEARMHGERRHWPLPNRGLGDAGASRACENGSYNRRSRILRKIDVAWAPTAPFRP